MTDPLLADATYIEPIHWESVEKIIEKENLMQYCQLWEVRRP